MVKVIIFDTETTGLPKKRRSALDDADCWPDLVSLSWSVFMHGEKQSQSTYLIKPENWTIPPESTQIHGITHEYAIRHGVALRGVMDEFKAALLDVPPNMQARVVAHNLNFDKNVLFHAWKWRLHDDPMDFWRCDEMCTMRKSEGELKLPHANSNGSNTATFKWPSLDELWVDTFKMDPPARAHCAERDVRTLEQICTARWKDAVFA